MIILLTPIVAVAYIYYSFYIEHYGLMLVGGVILLIILARFIDQGAKLRNGYLSVNQLSPIHETKFYLIYHLIGTLIGYILIADLIYVTYKLIFS